MDQDKKSLPTEGIPVWNLVAEESAELSRIAESLPSTNMTPERLADLRNLLTTFSDSPVATLEMHKLDKPRDPKAGIALQATSPLAQQLAELVAKTPVAQQLTGLVKTTSGATAQNGETLYRMVVPANLGAQLSNGTVRTMSAKGASGAIHSGLLGKTGIVGQLSFVPVTSSKVATTGMAGAGVTATAGAGAAGALTVAAPLVLLAVAAAATVQAENQRTEAIAEIKSLVEELHELELDKERAELNACGDAIDSATSILLDQGLVGHSLGLDSAANNISELVHLTRTRLEKWQVSLQKLQNSRVDRKKLEDAFPGLLSGQGKFAVHLEIAKLAISLYRRLLVVQAVEHAQNQSEGNPLTYFLKKLQRDERKINQLEFDIQHLLKGISELELRPGSRMLNKIAYTQSDVESFVELAFKLKSIGAEQVQQSPTADMVIEIEQHKDGSLTVFSE